MGETPEAPIAARKALATLGPLSREERITAVAFTLMVSGWIFADKLGLNVTSIAFLGLGLLLMAGVLTLDDISNQGDTLTTFLWLAVLFALSGQLNELGFMGYAGQILAKHMGGLSWPVTYVGLIVIYVAIHYMFVSQSSQVLALLGVFLDVGIRGGVPAPLMAFGLLFASSYFSVITPQGGSQNVIFVGSGYLTQRELYRLGLLTTALLPRGVSGDRNGVDTLGGPLIGLPRFAVPTQTGAVWRRRHRSVRFGGGNSRKSSLAEALPLRLRPICDD